MLKQSTIENHKRKKLARSGGDHGVTFLAIVAAIVFVLTLIMAHSAKADVIDIDRLANAIYMAEGGAKTKHPYGILAKYKHTTPRQACINTIKSNLKRFSKSGESDFILFMSRSYCPIGAKNDPTGLNRHWVKNVKHFYNRG